MLNPNLPAVVEEISSLHDAYETALIANDISALNAFFWDSPNTVRYGVNENLYGAEAVAAYRQGNTPVFTDRVIERRTVVALGNDVASVMCELSQKVGGQPSHIRQSQTWARFPEVGWKIVSAHVSKAFPSVPTAPAAIVSWENYVDQAARAIDLTLSPSHRTGVAQNLQRASIILGPLLALSLPEDAEVASVFIP